jgi:hypothetical protein
VLFPPCLQHEAWVHHPYVLLGVSLEAAKGAHVNITRDERHTHTVGGGNALQVHVTHMAQYMSAFPVTIPVSIPVSTDQPFMCAVPVPTQIVHRYRHRMSPHKGNAGCWQPEQAYLPMDVCVPQPKPRLMPGSAASTTY